MSIGGADIHKAMQAAWQASGLDVQFKDLWSTGGVDDEFVVLHDLEAAPEQPWPYCTFDQTSSLTTDRMSGEGSTLREIRDTSLTFHVFARTRDGDVRTAKEIAAFLIEEIMKVFGGHPTVAATETLSLDNGNLLIIQYVNDFGIRIGDDEMTWVLEYNIRSDVPVAI